MSATWSRLDGRKPQEHRRRELCNYPLLPNEVEENDTATPASSSSSTNVVSHNALLTASDVRLTYAQGDTRVHISLSGPTTSKLESAYEKAHVSIRLRSNVGILAIQPLVAVGGAPEKYRFLEARRTQWEETYAAVLLPLLQSCVERVVCLDQFPQCVILLEVLVLAEDGSLFAAVLNGCMCAILEAGLPCKTSFAAVTLAAVTTSSAVCTSTSVDTNSKKDSRKRERDDAEGRVLDIVADPTSLEETLSGIGCVESPTDSSSAAHAAAVASTLRGQLLSLQRDYRTVAIATFVLGYRPGGGTADGTPLPTIASHISSGFGSSRASTAKDNSGVFLTVMEWLQMEQMAATSVKPIFEFYRKLNVPLD